MTTDMEIITSEILEHRVVGRFSETVQYLRRRHIVPIDAPKTIRGKHLVQLSALPIQTLESPFFFKSRRRVEFNYFKAY